MTKEEILKQKNKSVLLSETKDSESKFRRVSIRGNRGHFYVNEQEFTEHFKRWNFFDTKNPYKFGQYFLYEKLIDYSYKSDDIADWELFYPKLGVYINALPCDQTLELEWVDYRKTWESRLKFTFEWEGKSYQRSFSQDETEIQRLPIWGDTLFVYDVWEKFPDWKQLRQAYERTWWFHKSKEEIRDIQISRILKY